MSKNEYNKGLTNESLNNNSNEAIVTVPSLKKKIRKDAKGNLIVKKKIPIKKSKFHAYLVDDITQGKNVADIINVESYKRYNLDDEGIEEEEAQPPEIIEENAVTNHQSCCLIF